MITYTLEQLEAVQKEQLTLLIEKCGGINHLAKMLGVHYMTVKGWEERGRISKDGAIKVERHDTLKGWFTALNLRPDL